jgi:predicted transcriptional regulator
MNVEIKPNLERRLRVLAQKRSQSVSDLVEEALTRYLDTLETESSSWIETTQNLLGRVWAKEDFTDWNPPDGR